MRGEEADERQEEQDTNEETLPSPVGEVLADSYTKHAVTIREGLDVSRQPSKRAAKKKVSGRKKTRATKKRKSRATKRRSSYK